ncbi:proteasome regulatory particle base subunit [Martiniozyma asiatica (nom. inval.)]|nr:proteasome regulatory particle base subunit [Martiniozyma asiatica]
MAPSEEKSTLAGTEEVSLQKPVEGNKKNVKKEEELSTEDQQLKDELEMLVERLMSTDSQLYQAALDNLKRLIKESTSSMTAVPKPLKFLRPFYPSLTQLSESWSDDELLKQLFDVLSILGMTYSKEDGEEFERESLKYRLKSTVDSSMTQWGHEYVRHLALEMGEEYEEVILEESKSKDELIKLCEIIIPYFLKHNAEAEAVDLLLELEEIQKLPEYVDKNTYKRICLYMVACVPLLAPPDDLKFLNTAYTIYLQNNKLPEALSLAIRIDDESYIKSVFDATDDELMQKQLGFILGRHNSCFKTENEEVQNCINNLHISKYFEYLAEELNLKQPKVPEDIYKSHLENSVYSSTKLESAKQNLAAAFVNGIVNAGYGEEKLINDERWVFKTRDEGMLSTVASLGLVNLWNFEKGLQALDQYQYNERDEIKAGSILGMGVSTSGVRDDVDSIFYLLGEYIQANDGKIDQTALSAITGLGIAYAGSQNEGVLEMLAPMVSDPEYSLEVQSLSALSLGHVFVGTCNGEVTDTILQSLLEKEPSELTSKWIKFMSLGLGLLYMGKYDQVEDVLEAIDAIEHPISKSLRVLITICAYAGTGNVLQVQELLSMCTSKPSDDDDDDDEDDDDDNEIDEEKIGDLAAAAEGMDQPDIAQALREMQGNDAKVKLETEEEQSEETEEEIKKSETESKSEDNSHQGFAVLGLALICMSEEIGQQMSLRHFEHLMHYGNSLIKRAVPLAMGLVSASNPDIKVFETLSRYSHDQDLDVAYNAIFSMGLVGAGTNNARLAQLLRQLASYYINDQNGLFTARIAQGLIHLGKGTQTLSPFSIDKQNLSKVSLAGLLTVTIALLDPTSLILGQNSNLLYYLTPAIKPRMLVTVDEDLNPIKINVRVGQSVDTVGAAGKPKTITGWVTHSTPVLLGYGEKAELEDDEYLPLASSLEGVVILKKNSDFVEYSK